MRPSLVLIVLLFAVAAAACVLNGQPTPPDLEAGNTSDATVSPNEPSANDSTGFDGSLDGSLDGSSTVRDASSDAGLDSSADVLEGGGG